MRTRRPRWLAQQLFLETLESRCVPSYTVTGLGTLGGNTSYPNGLNAAGQVVGESDLPGNLSHHGFLYSGGMMQDLGTLGGNNSSAEAINNVGQVAGSAEVPGGAVHAFLYSGGMMQDLGTLGGTESLAHGLNDAGQVVGEAETANGVWHAFLYSGGVMQDLGTLGGDESVAYGINSSGQVVGAADTPPADIPHAFVYSGGVMQDLGTLGGAAQGSYAYAINDAGQVVGESETARGAFRAFVYSGGVMQDLGTLGGSDSFAAGINNLGQVVGGADTAQGPEHAFLFDGGALTDLNTLIPADSGWILEEASGINDAGLIIAWGTGPSGQDQAVLLTPDAVRPSAPLGQSGGRESTVPQPTAGMWASPWERAESRPAAPAPSADRFGSGLLGAAPAQLRRHELPGWSLRWGLEDLAWDLIRHRAST